MLSPASSSARAAARPRSTPPPERRIALWRTPRARSLLLVAAAGVVAGAISLAAHVYTELLWFREVGQEQAFWTTLRWRVLGYGLPASATAAFVLANLLALERAMRRAPVVRPYRQLAYPFAAIAAGAIAAGRRSDDLWQHLLLWAGRTGFGAADPLFGRDAGFYVFSLPLQEEALRWAGDTLVLAVVASAAAYVAASERPQDALRAARGHLLVLAALGLLAAAWRTRLDQYALALPHDTSVLPGAGYTDVRVRLPAMRLLTLACVAGSAVCLRAAWRKRLPGRDAALVGAVAAVALVAEMAVAPLVQRFEVEPQELSRERPFLAHSISATRRAFALDRVAVRAPPAGARLTGEALARNRATLRNVPLWDGRVLRPALDELQSIGRYYGFARTTLAVHRGRLLAVAARELDHSRLGASTWANDHFAYTHGYGAVAVRAGEADDDGHPRIDQGDFLSGPGPLGLREPRIYFGNTLGDEPDYVVARTHRREVDAPAAGTAPPRYRYTGDGGIAISDPLRRVAFAARFHDLRLLLTSTLGGGSRMLLHRDARERVDALAPFLGWDRHPLTAVVGGRVAFVFHGYTSADSYPYARRVAFGGDRVSYVRSPVVATVDAFSGRVRLYAVEPEEPILRAWRAAYPSLFTPGSAMPPELIAQLRYPERLFVAQARAYASYHAEDPVAFWNGSDALQPAEQLSGPVERAGNVRFPEEGEARPRPEQIYARLPGDDRERLLVTESFSPRGRQNLAALLAGAVDEQGRPELSALSLPRDLQHLGPTQATRRILANPEVNDRLELLNRESRDLGVAAVNRTILGAARLVPVGGVLVHVQPFYVVSGGSGLPELQLVTVCADGRVGAGDDVETALRRALPGAVSR